MVLIFSIRYHFLGKFVIIEDSGSGEAGCSKNTSEKLGKEYAWSRGLGIETSPIKTRSARKKSSSTYS
jgi:hypothetical protein